MQYEFFTYDKFKNYLNILTNQKCKNQIVKKPDLGYSPCGFPIEHYSLGHGPKHLSIIAGTHGTEIIGIDFVLKLMEVISKGIGDFKDFNPNLFTLDFIPCQNPESFIIVTESLKPYLDNLNSKEFEKISKEYYLNYVKDDRVYIEINNYIKSLTNNKKLIDNFWNENRLHDITPNIIISFINKNVPDIKNIKVDSLFEKLYELKIVKEDKIIHKEKFHHQMFPNLSYQNIEEKDERYTKLKNKLKTIMEKDFDGYTFPKQSVIDFRANSNGVDLNKNNPNNFKIKNKEIENSNHPLFGTLRFNTLMREVSGPQGTVSITKEKFTFEKENIALLKHLLTLQKEEKYISALSYHGTGGVIYFKPYNYKEVEDKKIANKLKYIDKVNTELTTAYQEFTDYKSMPYPTELTGTGDMLRHMFPEFLIIELSKMGGNPIGPYGDINNYKKVINDNLKAFHNVLKIIEKTQKNKEM